MSEQRNELQAYYHDQYGTVYRHSAEHKAYLACGKLIGDETLAQAIDRIFEDEQEECFD